MAMIMVNPKYDVGFNWTLRHVFDVPATSIIEWTRDYVRLSSIVDGKHFFTVFRGEFPTPFSISGTVNSIDYDTDLTLSGVGGQVGVTITGLNIPLSTLMSGTYTFADLMSGNDMITGGPLSDAIEAGFGNDTVLGGTGNDTLSGDVGNDRLDGGAGNDRLNGGAGDDTLVAGSGNDTLDAGGSGSDVLDYSNLAAPIIFDMPSMMVSKGTAGTDALANFGQDPNTDGIVVIGTVGNDTFIVDNKSPYFTVEGGAGNDTITALNGQDGRVMYASSRTGVTVNLGTGTASDGFGGTDTLVNILRARGSDFGDRLIGSDANNQFEPGAGNDTIDGAAGFDAVRYHLAPSGIVANLATGMIQDGFGGTDLVTNIERVRGSDFADSITGSNANERLDGDGNGGIDGNDTLAGLGGDDTLYGGAGHDMLDGGAGNDWLSGDAGNDTLTGGTGADVFQIRTGEGADVITDFNGVAGDRIDLHEMGIGNFSALRAIALASGSDTVLTFAPGNTLTLRGVALSSLRPEWFFYKSIDGTAGNDSLPGTASDDIMNGFAGDDTLTAGAGNDSLYGGDGNDSLLGGDGDDWLDGGAGADTIDGGAGNDGITYSNSAAGVTVNLGLITAQLSAGDANGDVLKNIERLNGSRLADRLTGSGGADNLYGDAGNDTLDGAAGNDYLDGGAGNDSLLGGSGNDFLHGGAGADALTGGDGVDTAGYYASSVGVTVNLGLSGAQTSLGDAAGDVLSGIENLGGSLFADRLTGNSGANSLYADAGNDTLDGAAGNDNLNGGDGNDSLLGGDGDDWLDGGAGNDTLTGGNGADVFKVRLGQGVDVVTDFNGGAGDRVDLYETTIGSFSALQKIATALGSDTVLTFAPGNTLTLRGVALSSLRPEWFFYKSIDGTVGNDSLPGTASDDIMNGFAGDDTLTAGAGNDSLSGGDGDDWLSGGFGRDMLDGGSGYDYADYGEASGGVTVNLASGTSSGADGTDTLRNIERVRGSAFADTLIGSSADNFLRGGAGNDLIDGGDDFDYADYINAAGSVTVNLTTGTSSGADGVDTLRNIEAVRGSAYNDTLIGDGGDNFLRGGVGNDSLDGGAGFDFADYINAKGSVTVNLATKTTSGADGVDTLRNIEGIRGSSYDDTLIGDSGDNCLRGGAGNDLLDGGAGFDFADYINAADSVTINLATKTSSGPDGVDILRNIEGIRGSNFADTLIGDAGDNYLRGGVGNDSLDGGAGFDFADYINAKGSVTVNLATKTTSGADGVDTLRNIEGIRGSSYDDTLIGDSGDNCLRGGAGNDLLDGGAGFDFADYINAMGGVTVSLATKTSSGPDGVDTLRNIEGIRGSNFADTLIGDGGDNFMRGRGGNDLLDGGDGYDYADYSDATGSVTVSLATKATSGAEGADTLRNIEGIRGSAFTDTLIGDGGANFLRGGAGNDVLDGGAGYDYADYINAKGSVIVNLATKMSSGADDVDTLRNIEGIRGSAFADTLTGDAGSNYLRGGVGNDLLDGGDGYDYADYINAAGGVTVNLTTGTSSGADGVDILRNIEGIRGSASADKLIGDAGNNILYGLDGNDTLIGGAGSDTLYGGTGADQFRLERLGDGGDVISDFTVGFDKIAFAASSFGGLPSGQLAAQNFALNAPIDGDDWFVFNTTTGILSYDADGTGTGTAVALAALNVRTLSASDIMILGG